MSRQENSSDALWISHFSQDTWDPSLSGVTLTSPEKLRPIVVTPTALLLYHKGDHSPSSAAGEGHNLRHYNILAVPFDCRAWIIKPGRQLYSGWSLGDVRCCFTAAPVPMHTRSGLHVQYWVFRYWFKWSQFKERFDKEELKDNAYWPALQLVAWWRCIH